MLLKIFNLGDYDKLLLLLVMGRRILVVGRFIKWVIW